MAEKNAKKDQGKNKKSKQNDKKKNHENDVKHYNEQSANYNNSNQKKKDKNNKNSGKSAAKKKSGSFVRSFFKFLFFVFLYTSLFFGFFYIVDYERFTAMKNGLGGLASKAVGLLPDEVTSKGKMVVDFLSPGVSFAVDKSKVVVGHVSHFLNTNTLVKDHWINIREISSITSARMVEYVRTLYSHATGVFAPGKSKLSQ